MGLDPEKGREIIKIVADGTHRFKDINKEASFSKATVSTYLKDLVEKEILRKDLTEEETVGYFLTDLGQEIFEENVSNLLFEDFDKDEHLEFVTNLNKSVDIMDEHGIFTEGINEEDIVEILQSNPVLKSFDIDISDKDIPNLEALWLLISLIGMAFKEDMMYQDIELKLRIDPPKGSKKRDKEKLEDIMDKIQGN